MAFDGECDNDTAGLQLQQFLDEWHYRVIHSGLAMCKDRTECLNVALQLLEMHGSAKNLTQTEGKPRDEAQIVQEMVGQMPAEARKSFVHFALQLQLVIAAATRVRHALDEGNAEEVTRIMEQGDAGVNSSIMRQAIVESSVEIGELNRLHSSWWKNMQHRLERLTHCAEEAVKAEEELEAINGQVDSFSAEQNDKSKKVLASIAGNSDKMLLTMSFKDWAAHYRQYLADKEFHDKFRKQLDDCQGKLMAFKLANKAGSAKMMMGQGKAKDQILVEETYAAWVQFKKSEKAERELQQELKDAQDAIDRFKAAQSDNSMKVMQRMSAGNDTALKTMTFQGWQKALAEIKSENEMAKAVAAQQKALEEHLEKAGAEARQIVSRMFGSGDKGLLMMVRQMWNDLYKEEKKEMENDEAMQRANESFSKLSASRKRTIKSVAERTNNWEQEMILFKIFQDWKTQAKLDRLVGYYGSKMDQKKHQLDAVQSMFKSFANQLESGISTTPRSGKKGAASSAKPPLAPAA
jgi:hypothetical protein